MVVINTNENIIEVVQEERVDVGFLEFGVGVLNGMAK